MGVKYTSLLDEIERYFSDSKVKIWTVICFCSKCKNTVRYCFHTIEKHKTTGLVHSYWPRHLKPLASGLRSSVKMWSLFIHYHATICICKYPYNQCCSHGGQCWALWAKYILPPSTDFHQNKSNNSHCALIWDTDEEYQSVTEKKHSQKTIHLIPWPHNRNSLETWPRFSTNRLILKHGHFCW